VSSQATTHERQRDRYDLTERDTPGRALQIGGATSESLEPKRTPSPTTTVMQVEANGNAKSSPR